MSTPSDETTSILLAGRAVPVGETVLYDAHQYNPGERGRQIYRARILAVGNDTCRVKLDTGQEIDAPIPFLSTYSAGAVAGGARIRPVE